MGEVQQQRRCLGKENCAILFIDLISSDEEMFDDILLTDECILVSSYALGLGGSDGSPFNFLKPRGSCKWGYSGLQE